MIKEKIFDLKKIKENKLTKSLLKRKNIHFILTKEELIISKLDFDSQVISNPARLDICKHIEVVEYEILKKFIINHEICPVCSLKGDENLIYVDNYLKHILSLAHDKEENFIIINIVSGLWRLEDILSNNIYNNNDENRISSNMDSSIEDINIEFDKFYEDINQKDDVLENHIFNYKKILFELK